MIGWMRSIGICCRLLVGASLLFTFGFSSTANAEALDNKGRDFIFAFMPNYYGEAFVEVHLSSDVATNVTVEYPVNSPTFTTTVPVAPGSVTVVSLPTSAAQTWPSDGSVANNAVRAHAADEFVAYIVNRIVYTSDAALALPIDALNTNYIVSTYDAVSGSYGFAAEFVVTAAFDATTVTITPSNATYDGHAAGVPYNVALNRGESVLVMGASSGNNGGLTGTIVSGDKPITVTNGNGCTDIPTYESACDTVFEIAQPVQSWGHEALAVNVPDRPSGSIYRIVAAEDNTAVNQDGAPLTTLNRAQYIEVGPVAGNHLFNADKPIFVTQYMTGQSSPGATTGDPAMANMIPSAQYRPNYTFATAGAGQFAFHYLTVIAKNSDVGLLTLDGVAIPADQYSAIPGSDYSGALVSLPEGTHTTSSVNPHGITVEGLNGYDSYMFPGGGLFGFINPSGDANPPLCSLVNNEGTATDNRPSEDTNNNSVLDPGEDLNNNQQIDRDSGIFFIALEDGSSNVSLTVNPFVPGSGTVGFTVGKIDPALDFSGKVLVTDGAGNTCEAIIGAVTCEDTDLTAALVTLDGNGINSLKLGSDVGKSLRKFSHNKKAGKSEYAQLGALHVKNWTLTWTRLPRKAQNNCSNPSLCTTVDSVSALSEFTSSAQQMFNINQKLIKKLKKAGAPASLIKFYNAQNTKLLKNANDGVAEIPVTTLSCDQAA